MILIAGYYGFGNLGDELILSVLLKQLKKSYPKDFVVVLSDEPAHTKTLHRVHAVSRWNMLSVVWHMMWTDVFVLGGGGLLQDKTSFRSLFYYLALVAMALIGRKKIFLYAVGVETLQRPASKWLTRFLLSNSYVKTTVRDTESLKKLTDIGIPEKNIRVLPDPVFNLTLTIQPKEGSDRALERVLFIPRFPAPPSGLSLYNEIRFLLNGRLGLEIDEVVFEPRVEKLKRPEARSIEDVEQLIELLSACDVVVSARYHGLVLAALAGRPFIGVGDLQKTGRLCESLQMPFLGWEASRVELEAALGRLNLGAGRRDVFQGFLDFVDQLF